jgi:hypothetical protein
MHAEQMCTALATRHRQPLPALIPYRPPTHQLVIALRQHAGQAGGILLQLAAALREAVCPRRSRIGRCLLLCHGS